MFPFDRILKLIRGEELLCPLGALLACNRIDIVDDYGTPPDLNKSIAWATALESDQWFAVDVTDQRHIGLKVNVPELVARESGQVKAIVFSVCDTDTRDIRCVKKLTGKGVRAGDVLNVDLIFRL